MAKLTLADVKELLDQNLAGWAIEEFTEVYMTNEDGRKTKSLGFFKREEIAKGFAQGQKDKNFCITAKALILTNGKRGFTLGEEIEILDDEKASAGIKARALEKLTPEERKALGL